MLDFLSWGHLLVIALAAFFIFGPERLPTLARDAATGLRRARAALTEVREQFGGGLPDELGEDLAALRDLDLRRYSPRAVLRDQLFGAELPGDGDRPAGTPPTAGAWDRSLPPPVDVDAT